MAGNSAEMKVKATMDNSDLKKKSKESKDALKDFAKVGEDAVSSLGSAFGVNTGKIEQMMSAVRGLGENLSKSGNTGTAALGNLLKGVNGLTAGIAGIGIGAAVAGFKMLKDEAENFKQTVAGANMELATTAYIDTYKQVIHDFNKEIGSSFADLESRWKKFWGTLGSKVKASVTTGALFAGFMSPEQGMQAIENYSKLMSEAKAKGEEAARLQEEILNLTDDLSKKSVGWQKTESRIAEYKRKAYDTTVDTTERQKALAEVQRLITERYKEEYDIRNAIATKTHQLNELASSSREDEHKENELKKQAYSVQVAMNDKLRELLEKQATLTKQAQQEAKAREEAAAAAAKMAQSKAELQAWADQATITTPLALPTQAVALNTPGLAIPITPELDTSGIVDITNELQSALTSAFDTIGTSIGSLVADLATGGDAWSNFANSAISAAGDMAIAVGKIAIQTGVAELAIEAALKLGGGWAAIAAGTALVALGAAVKTSLSNIAGGNYSSAGAVATSTGSYGSSYSGVGTSFDTRDITVNVRGSLRADGNQLLAVIENENTRRNHTT